MKQFIEKLKNKENLTQNEIEEVMHEIMSGNSASEDISAFLVGLNEKGPTIEEITGAANLLRQFMVKIPTKHKVVLDVVGTGGDCKHTFNISTISAIVVAASGVVVAKHGNRSVSSKCGSADVLEGLGVNLNLEGSRLSECLDEVGIAFLFAQKLHPAMKNVAPVRKALETKTIFNILGPLINPAQATHQLMGVYNCDLVEPMAHVLKNLGLKKALVVHGNDGLDEITTTDITLVSEWNGKEVISYKIDPQELGVPQATEADLKGGDVDENVRIAETILDGALGAKRDIVLLNSAYALYAAEKVKNVAEGVKIASQTIISGNAREKLQELVEFTKR